MKTLPALPKRRSPRRPDDHALKCEANKDGPQLVRVPADHGRVQAVSLTTARANPNITRRPSRRRCPYSTVSQWIFEMMDCEKVDPENKFRYENTMTEAYAVRVIRLRHFVERHGLWEQFIAEDAEGTW